MAGAHLRITQSGQLQLRRGHLDLPGSERIHAVRRGRHNFLGSHRDPFGRDDVSHLRSDHRGSAGEHVDPVQCVDRHILRGEVDGVTGSDIKQLVCLHLDSTGLGRDEVDHSVVKVDEGCVAVRARAESHATDVLCVELNRHPVEVQQVGVERCAPDPDPPLLAGAIEV